MNEKYGSIIFVMTVAVALMSGVLTVVYESHLAHVATEKKCTDAGWVWFTTENKCIMVKEVK